MSFGFSVGDFFAAGNLIKEIVSAIRGSATAEYRELELELYGLQLALIKIEELRPAPGQETAVNAVKVASLMCQYPLEEFLTELRKYEKLSDSPPQAAPVMGKWIRSTRWKLEMEDEVVKLRAYIMGHVGSLNMRLTTLGLEIMTSNHTAALERDQTIRHGIDLQSNIVGENTAKVESVYTIVSKQLLPQVQNLIKLVSRVWLSNMEILGYLTKAQSHATKIDVEHTWFQKPLKLEDAFGRVMPIPAEYEWSTFQAIIQDRFRYGPGHEKVFAGEYEVFCTEDSSKVITEQVFSFLKPGISITMAIVIGRYYQGPKDICPRPGCLSKDLTTKEAGGMLCNKCQTWFGFSRKTLPKPFRSFYIEDIHAEESNPRSRKRNLERFQRNIFREMRDDRKWYKNLRVDITDVSAAFAVLDIQRQLSNGGTWEDVKGSETHRQLKSSFKRTEVSVDNSRPVRKKQCPMKTDVWKAAGQLIFEELGVDGEDDPIFDNNPTLEELGLDSLVQLAILSRLGVYLNKEIWGSRVLPLEPLTMKDFRNRIVLAAKDGEENSAHLIDELNSISLMKQKASRNRTSFTSNAKEKWTSVLIVICEELGVSREELEHSQESFQVFGLDSLMALNISGSLRKKFPELYFESTVFIDYDTVGALRSFVYGNV